MKKSGILHAELSRVIAALGHGDMLVVGDAGLPVPRGVSCIDLAVTAGVPGFWDVLDAIMEEMEVERAVIAAEASESFAGEIASYARVEVTAHAAFKVQTGKAVAVVRTGEATPYHNVALIAGVAF